MEDIEVKKNKIGGNFLCKISYEWVTCYALTGIKEERDVPSLPSSSSAANLGYSFGKKLQKKLKKGGGIGKFSFLFLLFGQFWLEIIACGFLQFFQGIFLLLQPFIQALILQNILLDGTWRWVEWEYTGYILVVFLLVVLLLSSFTKRIETQFTSEMIIKLRAMTMVQIYRKFIFLQPNDKNPKHTFHLMEVETKKLQHLLLFFHFIWFVPFFSICTIGFLYYQIGIPSLFSFAILALYLPLQLVVSSIYFRFMNSFRGARDLRKRMIREIFKNIFFVKVNNLESSFMERIFEQRKKEIFLFVRLVFGLGTGQASATMLPFLMLVILASLSFYMDDGKYFTMARIFPCFTHILFLSSYLPYYPLVIGSVLSSINSLNLISKYLSIPANHKGPYVIEDSEIENTSKGMEFKKCDFVLPQKINEKKVSERYQQKKKEILQLRKERHEEETKKIVEKEEKALKKLRELKEKEENNPQSMASIIAEEESLNFGDDSEEDESSDGDVEDELMISKKEEFMEEERSYFHLDMEFEQGKFYAICGEKESTKYILQCISGEIILRELSKKEKKKSKKNKEEEICVARRRGNMFYLTEDPWCFENRSLGYNIVFHSSSDNLEIDQFRTAVRLSTLDKVFDKRKPGDVLGKIRTETQQKVCIARAIYRNTDIYIMDEIFNNIKDGKEIFENVMMNHWEDRTRILVTHDKSILEKADLVLVTNQHDIVQKGRYEDLVNDEEGFFHKKYIVGSPRESGRVYEEEIYITRDHDNHQTSSDDDEKKEEEEEEKDIFDNDDDDNEEEEEEEEEGEEEEEKVEKQVEKEEKEEVVIDLFESSDENDDNEDVDELMKTSEGDDDDDDVEGSDLDTDDDDDDELEGGEELELEDQENLEKEEEDDESTENDDDDDEEEEEGEEESDEDDDIIYEQKKRIKIGKEYLCTNQEKRVPKLTIRGFYHYIKSLSPCTNIICSSCCLLPIMCCLLILAQLALISPSIWFSAWVRKDFEEEMTEPFDEDKNNNNNNLLVNERFSHYIWIMILLFFFSAFMLWIKDLVFYASGIFAAAHFHQKAFETVIKAPMEFFAPRLNDLVQRFGHDQYILDTSLIVDTGILLSVTVEIFFMLIIIILAMYPSIFFVCCIICVYCISYVFLKRIFQNLHAIDHLSKSPIRNHVEETNHGATVLKILGIEDIWSSKMEECVDHRLRTSFLQLSARIWISLRLELFHSVITFLYFLFFILFVGDKRVIPGLDNINSYFGLPYFIGLGTTLILILPMKVSRFLEHVSRVESQGGAIQRVFELQLESKIPQEHEVVINNNNNNEEEEEETEFEKGQLTFEHANFGNVYPNVSLKLDHGKRIGIIGLPINLVIPQIFRLDWEGVQKRKKKNMKYNKNNVDDDLYEEKRRFRNHSKDGEDLPTILIDSFDIRDLRLKDLRRAIAVLVKDDIIFTDTLRMNLDPRGRYSDERLWDVLKELQLEVWVRTELKYKLGTVISDEDEEITKIRKRLICFGRILLKRNCRLVLIEEPDEYTDADDIIQRIIRKPEWRDRTVILFVKHFLTTLICEHVVVFKDRQVKEEGKPSDLVDIEDSTFVQLLKQAGEKIELSVTTILRAQKSISSSKKDNDEDSTTTTSDSSIYSEIEKSDDDDIEKKKENEVDLEEDNEEEEDIFSFGLQRKLSLEGKKDGKSKLDVTLKRNILFKRSGFGDFAFSPTEEIDPNFIQQQQQQQKQNEEDEEEEIIIVGGGEREKLEERQRFLIKEIKRLEIEGKEVKKIVEFKDELFGLKMKLSEFM